MYVHILIGQSFEKKKGLFIVDHIKQSPVYQVKCKLADVISIDIPLWSNFYNNFHYIMFVINIYYNFI